MRGYYLMHRGWLDHPALGGKREPHNRRSAWAWLIENAAYQGHVVVVAGKEVHVGRGQLYVSMRALARDWGWAEPKVRRFLEATHLCQMTECVSDAHGTLITICNYSKYQDAARVGDAPSDAPATHHPTHIKKEIKKVNKYTPPIVPPKGEIEAEFQEFYRAYPRHVGPAAAFRKYVVARKQADAETLLNAAKRFAEISAGKEPQFVAHPATWLHQGRWQDEDLQTQANGHDLRDRPDAPPPTPEERRKMREKRGLLH